ncbi:2-isopropylmalate synthase [Paenalkalicoccus suaedae]|uniref:2-isopropylmalate synthase n=1 Tax=Paenalkalicoccus suaedae TaxID=2592382 RepID=A0A859FCZ9_9BACI|nr:2-isopropylmalate synthase [Paenalkalicoccus suaedae]QKS70681.1 2-isopropylmalate synthase [Paenalkalicoccus suaedae]
MAHVKIFDTTLRDGEQSPGVNLNRLEKLEIAKQLERFGVDVMEAGFPASSQGDFEGVREIARTIKNASVTGLARAVKSDIDAAWEALKEGADPRLHCFIATSPIHMEYKLKKSPEQVIQTAVEMVKYGKKNFDKIEWSAEDASRSDLDFLARIIKEVIDAGATVINLPDTVGYTTPYEYGQIFNYITQNVPNIDKVSLSAHCHDDLGMAVANSIAAIENGATQVEGTINGIGERAGNAALEELAVALTIRKDFYPHHTGLVLNEIKRTSDLVSKLTGMVVPRNKAVVGQNAFAHESGIHQDGVLKHAETYEIITPELVGVKSNSLVMGKHSGKHAFKDKLQQLGYTLSDEKLLAAFTEFKKLTDKKKEVTDDDLFSILTEIQTTSDDRRKYQLESFQVEYQGTNQPTATATLVTPDGETVTDKAAGQGAVEALFNTLDSIVKEEIHITDFNLSSIGRGRDALAQANVKMTVNDIAVNGRGSSQDVLEAAVKGYINAVNRAFYFQTPKKENAVEAPTL